MEFNHKSALSDAVLGMMMLTYLPHMNEQDMKVSAFDVTLFEIIVIVNIFRARIRRIPEGIGRGYLSHVTREYALCPRQYQDRIRWYSP